MIRRPSPTLREVEIYSTKENKLLQKRQDKKAIVLK